MFRFNKKVVTVKPCEKRFIARALVVVVFLFVAYTTAVIA